jgi:hypothetical protein
MLHQEKSGNPACNLNFRMIVLSVPELIIPSVLTELGRQQFKCVFLFVCSFFTNEFFVGMAFVTAVNTVVEHTTEGCFC